MKITFEYEDATDVIKDKGSDHPDASVEQLNAMYDERAEQKGFLNGEIISDLYMLIMKYKITYNKVVDIEIIHEDTGIAWEDDTNKGHWSDGEKIPKDVSKELSVDLGLALRKLIDISGGTYDVEEDV